MYVDLASGYTLPCYGGKPLSRDLFAPPYSTPLPESALGACPFPHCYNGHALLTLGLIPGVTDTRYGDIRDRIRTDGSHWLQPEFHAFLNSQLCDSNQTDSFVKRKSRLLYTGLRRAARKMIHFR